jgi:hypothetical protein
LSRCANRTRTRFTIRSLMRPEDGSLAAFMRQVAGRGRSCREPCRRRTSVREAVKVLSAKGLLVVRRRIGSGFRIGKNGICSIPSSSRGICQLRRNVDSEPYRSKADYQARGRGARGHPRDRLPARDLDRKATGATQAARRPWTQRSIRACDVSDLTSP